MPAMPMAFEPETAFLPEVRSTQIKRPWRQPLHTKGRGHVIPFIAFSKYAPKHALKWLGESWLAKPVLISSPTAPWRSVSINPVDGANP